jgi:RND superfamily putative drug exporter
MTGRRTSRLERYGRQVGRWRWPVLALWVVLLAGAVVLAGRAGEVMTDDQGLPGSESQRGGDLIEQAFSDGSGTTSELRLVFRDPGATVDDPAFREAAVRDIDAAATVVPGSSAISYYGTGDPDLVGEDGHMTYATIRMPVDEDAAIEAVPEIREAVSSPGGPEVLVGGEAALDHDLDPVVEDDLAFAEMIVLPVALLVLLLFFGSLVGALLPLLMAVVTIVLAMAGTWAAGQVTSIADIVTNIIVLVGVAIGIDYSLLVVSRFRDEIRAGRSPVAATARTVATAGRAVLLSGLAVTIGLAVLIALPVPFIRTMGIGGMLVPAAAVIAALTLLPALLCVLGRRVDAIRVYPRRWTLAGLWRGWSRVVTRGAPPLAIVGIAVLGATALQATGMGIHPDPAAQLPDAESVRAERIVRDELGGAANPNVLVVDSGRPGGVFTPAAATAIDAAANDLRARTDTVSGAAWPRTTDPEELRTAAAGLVDPTGRYALLQVAPLDDELSDSARRLNGLMAERGDALEAQIPEAEVLLTGVPAGNNDFIDAIYARFGWLVAGVLVLTFAGMAWAFRSWVVPLLATAMAGLSLAASYGLTYLVFQRGIGADLVGLDEPVRGIAPWVPVFAFAFLYGISMDYQVFLVERIRELRESGASARDAARAGLASTGRVILTAALIMVVAFGGFVGGQMVEMKQFGFALAAAVAVDALLIRLVIVPAVMYLAGERGWGLGRGRRGMARSARRAYDRGVVRP